MELLDTETDKVENNLQKEAALGEFEVEEFEAYNNGYWKAFAS